VRDLMISSSPSPGARPAARAEARTVAGPDSDRVITRSRLLLAPGGRFRQEFIRRDGAMFVTGSDGEIGWETADDTEGQDFGGSWPPGEELLCPAWLASQFELEVIGPAVVAGRHVVRLTARQRPLQRGRSGPEPRGLPGVRPRWRHRSHTDELIDQIDIVADTELGILLRCERLFDGKIVSSRELTNLTLNPPEAADPSRFQHPADEDADGEADPGSLSANDAGRSSADHDGSRSGQSPFSGPGWRAAKSAASLGASALGAAVRRKAHGAADPWQAAANCEHWDFEGDDLAAAAATAAGPVGERIVSLLYQAGLRLIPFDAELRAWRDTRPPLAAMRRAGDRSGISGLGHLADALGEQATELRQRAAIRFSAPSRYRIDYLDSAGQRRPRTIAADGEHRWRVYADRTAVGAAVPLPAAMAGLLDPAWLLDWQLTGGIEGRHGDRAAFAICVHDRDRHSPSADDAVIGCAVVDAELGIILHYTRMAEGQPVSRVELCRIVTGQQHTLADFRIDVPPGTHVVKDTGGPVDWSLAPPAVRVAAGLAKRAFDGATAARGLADRLRGNQGGHQRRS
jgi:hypothetical protein